MSNIAKIMKRILSLVTLALFAVLLISSCSKDSVSGQDSGEITVTSITLDPVSLTMTAGQTATINVSISPANASNKTVVWESSNTAVATVEGGKVTALSQGTATITAKTADGGKQAKCSVEVTAPALPAEVNPDYVPIDWTKYQLEQSDSDSNVYIIRTNGNNLPLKQGSVIIVGNMVKVVENVSQDGNTCTLSASDGDICNVFQNVEFTLATSSEAAVATKAMEHNVFYPVEITYCNQNGGYITKRMSQTKSTTFTHDLWTWGKDLSGTTIKSGNNWRIFWESACYKLDIDAAITLSFGERSLSASVGSAVQQYKSKALWIDAAILGTFDMDALLKFEASGSFKYQEKEDEMFIHNVFKPVDMKFMVYGVPVVITLSSDMFRGASLQGSGNVEVSAGAHDIANGKLGFKWTQLSGTLNPYRSFDNTFSLHLPNTKGQGTLEGKCWVYPRVKLLLYSVPGPSFDIKPYQKAVLKGGYNQTLGGSANDYFAWSIDTYSGIDAAVGLSVSYMNYEVENLTSPDFNIIESKLYSSPYSITDVSNKKFKEGRKETAIFEVKDWNGITKSDITTPLSQVVRFEADGELSKEYAICSNGQVNVEWTPKDGDDKLYARLYNMDGSVLDEAVIETESNCPDGSHPHAIDLGLSVKWACCNVGASKPEEYGGYYAWGETSEKSEYGYATYKYWKDGCYIDDEYYRSGFTKYVSDSHSGFGGFTDGKTVLDLVDDVAHVKWGGSWRMPTHAEFKELVSNCTSKWTELNGVKGRRFTSKINGNSIFLPASGCMDYTDLYNVGSAGGYRSSSLDTDNDYRVWGLYFYSDFVYTSSIYGRYFGLSVRPVSE